MSKEHTPGPWGMRVFPKDAPCTYDVWDIHGPGGDYDDIGSILSSEADARLVVGAPDLLAALETIETEAVSYLSSLRRQGKTSSVVAFLVNTAQAALAKARGEEETT